MTSVINVRRHPSDYRIATYACDRVFRPRWDDETGGLQRGTGRLYLFAYVMCDEMIDGELAHSCRHGQAPHEIKVCITKVGNDAGAYKALAEKAGPKEDVTAKRRVAAEALRRHLGEQSG
ncbi:hypothetical protein [Sphingosinicella rhizophila]|uniref:Uncharacterized protein n=1 Tax=Sphingosinicella rhizophila TaxID=3050082 RepID=A0ABU3Q5F4_9SPHN|nr:hypothetical protein [Sphingosinicella sp. GR2756]MDT9598542.1 hypothetical protein [Sphingosinicella sp. GR2756]